MLKRKVWLARTMSSKKRIFDACRKGDLPQLKRVLEETQLDVGSEPLGSEGETALHVACAHGHLDIVQYLVNDRGCSVAAPNSRAAGATPLEVAWANKHWEVVEFLLKTIQGKKLFAEVGLAPTTVTQLQKVAKYGDEALHQACTHGYLETVKSLTCSDYLHLEKRTGHDPTAVSFHGTTPLQVAWENKHWEVASYLLQALRKCHGHVPSLPPAVIIQLLEMVAFGECAFHIACSRGDLEVVRYLHESLKCSLTQQNAQGETPLDVARLNGHLHVIHFLLESGECSAPDMTELHIACMGRDEERVKNLASDISSLRTPDQYGITAVHYATYQPENLNILVSIAKQKNMLSLLVRQDERRNTPLHYAASCGFTRSVKFLISYYESVNMQNSDGDTPLHLSIKSSYCSFGSVREILQHKSCNPSTVNAQNETALHTASQYGKLKRAELLLLTGKCSQEDIKEAIEVNLLLHQAVATNRLELLKTLLRVPGCNINEFNSDGETPLHVACRSDFEVFKLLAVDSRCDLNAQNKNGLTALHITIASGQLEKCHLLITNVDCNPSIVCSDGNAPIHMMIEKDFHQSLRILLKHPKCNPNMKNSERNSALHLALREHSLACATCLLQHDRIDPNIQNENGNTPLHEAIMRGTPVGIVETLTLHKSYNPNKPNHEGMTPLQLSVDSGKMDYVEVLVTSGKCSHEDIVKATEGTQLLHQAVSSNRPKLVSRLTSIQECNINETTSTGETALHVACRTRYSKAMLKILVEDNRCDLNAQDQHGNTALHLAVYSGTDIAEKVLCILQSAHERCNPNITNSEGHTPLHVAVKERDFETAVVLLNHSQCNPSIQDLTGNTPLHLAISQISLSSVKSFLNHKNIDLNIQNREGNTPLHEAVMRWTFVDVVEALALHKSCNPNIVNNAGMTPLQISVTSGEVRHAEVLITSEKYSHEDILKVTEGTLLLHQAALSNRPKLALRLINIQECNITETNSVGETALHAACRTRCNKDVLKKLVEDSRCNLNAQDQSGNTALHLAVYSQTGVTEKVQCILQSERCNPNITNNEGYTPLHVAVKKGDFKAAVILLNHSQCNPNIQDLTGNTPLHMTTGEISLSNIECFLNHKNIDLNIQNREGNTPLHEAVMRQAPVGVIEAFTLHDSCNPNILNNVGMTPLQISGHIEEVDSAEVLITSGKCSHEDIVKVIEGTLLHQAVLSNRIILVSILVAMKECSMNETNSTGETALHVACRTRCSKAILEKLVEDNRCDLSAQTQCGDTALHVAVYSGTDVAEKVQCILQSERCNPNITNSEGYTPLHVAIIKGDFEAAAILLNHSQCNPNIQDLTGNTPLHIAIIGKSFANIKSFLNHKNIDLNIQNRNGNTPLHEAVMRQVPVDVVEGLTLHKSCNVSIANNAGMTPLQISADFEELNYAEVIITGGKFSHEDIVKATEGTLLLHKALLSNRPKLFFRLSKFLECNMNETNSAGNTILHLACITNHNKGVLKKLVQDSICDLNVCNQHGDTALHLAVYSGTDVTEKVQCILQSERCNPNITNSEGYTPLHVAVKQRDFETAVILLNHSQCNPNIQDLTGNTPLHMALASNISLPNVQPLLNHKDIDLSIQNGEENIPLHEAVKRQVPVDVVVALTLHKSCNPNIANNEGMTPLQISVTSSKLHYTDILITSGKCSHEDIVKATEGSLLLHQAMFSNRPKLIVALLSIQELNMNGTNSAGETPLHVACKMRHSEAVVEKLVEDSRCDLNAQDQHGNTALHLAASSVSDSAKKVQCICRSDRCNPNISNSDGHTPLHFAVIRKKVQSAEIILKHLRIDPNIQNKIGNTPLHEVVIIRAPIEIMESLILHIKVNPNVRNNKGNSTLHLAVRKHSLCHATYLLQHEKIDPNVQNKTGNTPLHEVIVTGAPTEIMESLIQHKNISPNVKNNEGNSALHLAVRKCVVECTTYLLQHERIDPNIQNEIGNTPLHEVVITRALIEIMETLILHIKINPNMRNNEGNSALHLAVRKHSLCHATYLLQHEKIDPNVQNKTGNTPLHEVTITGAPTEIMESLIQHKNINPNVKNNEGNSALHLAVRKCSVTSVTCLLQHDRIDPNIQNHNGNTPLHDVVMTRAPMPPNEIMQSLIQHKECNPQIQNKNGKTPLQIAAENGLLQYVSICILCEKYSKEELRDAASRCKYLLHYALSLNDIYLVEKLQSVLEYDINEANQDGETPLHIACRQCGIEAVQRLVADKRCDLNVQSNTGDTALHIAVYSELHPDLCSEQEIAEKVQCILQSERCNPNITNSEGYTPLHVAVKKRNFEIAMILVNHSQCNPNIHDLTGNTPLHIAIIEMSLSNVESFLNHTNIDLNIQNREGNTPLHEAIISSTQIDVVETLTLHKTCNPSIVNHEGMTPLMLSVHFGEVECVEVLVTSEKYSHEDIVKATEGALFLHQAVYSKRPRLVAKLLNVQDFNVNTTNSAGETALHVACKMRRSKAMLKKLVDDSRCDLNAQTQYGNTALHLAVYSGTDVAEKVQCILQSERCNPNITNSEGYTALHVAVSKGDFEAAVVLLNHSQCNPNIQDLTGNTPLHMTNSKISLSSVASFLNHKNIDLNIQNIEGNTPLHEAVMRQVPVDVVEALALHKGCNPNITNSEGYTPLHVAVKNEDSEAAVVLLNHSQCNPNIQDLTGNTSLHMAIGQISLSSVEKVQCILQSERCDPNVTNSEGYTPLHVAVRKEDSETAVVLLNHSQCNPNIQDLTGNTPLHMTNSKISLSSVDSFLNHKNIDLNIQNIEGNTPLHEAVMRRVPACVVEALTLHNSCDPNIVNNAGMTPLQISGNIKEIDSAEVLITSGKCSREDIVKVIEDTLLLHQAVLSNRLILVSILVAIQEYSMNETNSSGETALHVACRTRCSKAILEKLVENSRCDLSAQAQCGDTALHLAVYSGTDVAEKVQCIAQSERCNPNITNSEGYTPLHVAVKKGDFETAVILLNHLQCNPNIQDLTGNTPLHIAISEMSLANVESFLNHKNIDLNIQNREGNTPLHEAVMRQAPVDVVEALTLHNSCNPSIVNNAGMTPLQSLDDFCKVHYVEALLNSGKCNHEDMVKATEGTTLLLHQAVFSNRPMLVSTLVAMQEYNINETNSTGETALHVACRTRCSKAILEKLVEDSRCDLNAQTHSGDTALHLAVCSGFEVAEKVRCITQSERYNPKDEYPLIYAVLQEKAELLTALIEAGINVNASTFKRETALHIACKKGNTKATKLLLQNGADVLAVDSEGNAPIHVACGSRTFECLSLLLSHHACNPNQQNAVGDTPLHILCKYTFTSDMSMLRTLLSAPGINPECANNAGQIPAELAKSNYFVIEEISKYLNQMNTHLETYVKIFVVGNSGGGKSTLITAVTTEESKSWKSIFKAKHIKPSKVPPHTAGIIPLRFTSQHFGHAVLYDFAGQHEYYSSHAAVMENLVLPSPPLFLLLIDISKPMDEVREQLVYWWMFINNHSKQATTPPHVIVVGSHKDIVKRRGGNVQRMMEQITDIVRNIPVSFQFEQSRNFPLDCRKLVSQGLTALLTQLKLTCETLRQTADIDLHCHILKAFLTTNFHSSVACIVSEIAEKINPEDDLLPQEPSQLIPLLSTLSDKGHILLLENHTDVSKSWVVLKPELLLAEVNGSIFAPDNFKEHCSGFAMSTGVVPLSKIIEKFGEPNNQVIIGYLTHLEFCFQIKDQHTLEMITKDATLQLPTYGSENADEYYFFPSLIQKENPSDVCQPQETIKYECGWLYRCNEPTEQLTTRFLHVLILRLAFSCDPPDEPTESESVVLLRSCSVWKHGIAWWTNDGIETIVEVGLQCRWVAVMLRCPDTHKVQCTELRTKVINTVLKTKQDFCPAIDMKEFLIAPSSLQYPFEGMELTLYSIREIAKVVIAGKEFPIDTKGKSAIHISQLLPFEPFFNFGEDLIGNLFASDEPRERNMSRLNLFQIAGKCFDKLDDFKKALQPNPVVFQRECVKPDCTEVDRCVALFQIVQRRGCKTWRDFEHEFSRFSIFCGRDPRVSQNLML